jgi:hypothetical protein
LIKGKKEWVNSQQQQTYENNGRFCLLKKMVQLIKKTIDAVNC